MREVGGDLLCGGHWVAVTRGLPPSLIVTSSIMDFHDAGAGGVEEACVVCICCRLSFGMYV